MKISAPLRDRADAVTMSEPPARQILVNSAAVPRRRSPLQTLILLTILAAVLLVFIAWLGDWRRRHNIAELMRTQMESYMGLTTDAGLLPLNLKPPITQDAGSRLMDAWLTPDEARILRNTTDEVMVAWTVPLVRALGRRERAVIVFQTGRYDLLWLPPEDFNRRYARQVEMLQKLNVSAP
jgi:hypothetical protein